MEDNKFLKTLFLISFIFVYVVLCIVIAKDVYINDYKHHRTDVIINTLYEMDMKGTIELNTQAIIYLQEIDNLY